MPAFYPPDPPFQGLSDRPRPHPGSNSQDDSMPLLTNFFHRAVENSPPRDSPTEKQVSKQLVSSPGLTENLTQAHLPDGRTHGVYVVSVKGLKYYRYVVTRGHVQELSLHIPGGNVTRAIARRRAGAILELIRRGHSPSSIHAQIRSWGGGLRLKQQNR